MLFLDEFPEFKKDTLEALRQPLEDGDITITRASARVTYPARFMLVAAMNPCPCGNFGAKRAVCRCTPVQISRYRNRVSGPLLDRIDLHIEMTEVGYSEITDKGEIAESSAVIRGRVNAARAIQKARFAGDGILFNAQMGNALIEKYCLMEPDAEQLIKKAFAAYKLSARAYHRLRKVARTIADLEGAERIGAQHVAEAIQYRSLDSKYWET